MRSLPEPRAAHPRLSVHAVALLGLPLAEQCRIWRALGLARVSLLADQLFDPGLAAILDEHGLSIETVSHALVGGALPTGLAEVATARDALARTIEAAARLGSRSVCLLTGGRGTLSWERAANQFAAVVAPAVEQARVGGIRLLIEPASSLYADVHLAHSLSDAITLAQTAGAGLCIDLFHCWWEADFERLVERALPLAGLIQLSDQVAGERVLPARAVPGDGMIPIRAFVERVLALGYNRGFELELLGSRIDAEGRVPALTRAVAGVTTMLEDLGA